MGISDICRPRSDFYCGVLRLVVRRHMLALLVGGVSVSIVV